MVLSNQLAETFQEALLEADYFCEWSKEKSRDSWKRQENLHLGIDLQLGKYWRKNGGQVAVNLHCGHRWTVPTLRWVDDGFEYSSTRLSPIENGDKWWYVRSTPDLDQFATEFSVLLRSHAIPWFKKVATKRGFLEWSLMVNEESSTFPYVLEVYGKAVLTQRVCSWISSEPRRIDMVLQWLVERQVISPELSSRLKLASIQAEENYRERIPLLIKEIERERERCP